MKRSGWLLVVGIWLGASSVAVAGTRTVTVTGTLDDSQATVTVNGTAATIGSSGTFSAPATLTEGANTIAVTATDPAGNSASASIAVDLDTVPPVVVITSPGDGHLFGAQ